MKMSCKSLIHLSGVLRGLAAKFLRLPVLKILKQMLKVVQMLEKNLQTSSLVSKESIGLGDTLGWI